VPSWSSTPTARRSRSRAEVASVDRVSPVATLSAEGAFKRLAAAIAVDRKALNPVAAPRLTFFEDKAKGRWHLAFLFLDVPGRPRPRALDHGLAPSPRSAEPRTHCVVAATGTGRLLFRYGADPALSDLPVQCRGLDELDRKVVFWGRAKDGAYLLTDPQRHTETYDLGFRDLAAAPTPDEVISSTTVDWGDKHRAAISAHANGSRVLDFYNSVLFRDGIDGRSMPLVSLVNCLYRPKAPDEQHWANAVWYHDRMWYGQTEDATLGRLASYSRFLDVIAHELTHGVTATTSGLVYQGESGALNESFSDIFGVIIANWDDSRDDGGDVRNWAWTIGAGLGANGGPLRDLADPTRTGMPDHMTKFRTTAADNGGVHANSNIHNKAAYGVLTAKDAHGKRVFSPLDVARIYYWCLQRLNDRATFATVLAELVDVTSSLYAGDPVALDRAVTAIKKAYAAVGISA
jgi:bacillolysin